MPRRRKLLTAVLAAALAACGYNPKESGGRFDDLGHKGTVECLFAGCHDSIAATGGSDPGFVPAVSWALGFHGNPGAVPPSGDPECDRCHDPVDDLTDAAYLFTDPSSVADSIISDETLAAVGRTVRPVVGCEACHGTASEHYAYAGSALFFGAHRLPLQSTISPVFGPPLEMVSCGPCHSADVHAGGVSDQDILANQRAEWDGVDGTGLLSDDGHVETILVETRQGLMTSAVRGVPCAACHTVEGFVRFFAKADTAWSSSQREIDRMISVTADADLSNPPSIPGGSAKSQVTCVSCHQPHDPGRPLRRILFGSAGAEDDTRRRASLCGTCHNVRGLSAQAGAGLSFIASLEIPRHPQREVFLGTSGTLGAFAFTVLTDSPHAGTSNVPGACTACHYIVRSDVSLSAFPQKATSGHRFTPRLEGCLAPSVDPAFSGCHASDDFLLAGRTPFSYADSTIGSFDFSSVIHTPVSDLDGDAVVEPFQAEVEGLLAELRSSLNAAGAPYDTAQGVFDMKQMGALGATVRAAAYNYDFVTQDKSRGLHNPRYVVGVLKGSISALGH